MGRNEAINNVDSIDSTTCRCVSMDTKTGEFVVSYDGPQVQCAITDELYIGKSGRRVNEPVIQRIVHGIKKVYREYQGQGVCYFINIASDDTKMFSINIIVDNQNGYDDKELARIRSEFMDIMYSTYAEFFQACNDGIDLATAEQNTYDYMCKRIEDCRRRKSSRRKRDKFEKVAVTGVTQGEEIRGDFKPDSVVISIIDDELSKNTSNASVSEKAAYMMAVASTIAEVNHG